MKLHPAFSVAADGVMHVQGAGRLGDDAGFLEQFAHRPFADGFAEFEDAAREAPAPGVRLLCALHDQSFVPPHDDGQHRHDRPVGVAPRRPPGFEIGRGGFCSRICHCEEPSGDEAISIGSRPILSEIASLRSQ